MHDTEISLAASSFAGIATTWITQLVRHKLIKLHGSNALFFSLGVSLFCTVLAYFNLDKTPTITEFLSNLSVCIALSQVVYNTLSKEFLSTIVPGDIKE